MKYAYFILLGILLIAGFLRFYHLDQIPQGLYIDEVSIGTNAFSILQTGKDEHGVSYPLFFKAFGEYKMPVTIYLAALAIDMFGKTELAIRFFSAFLGTLTILLLYVFVKALFQNRHVALLSAVILAITPWHIQFSRGGFEATIALCFYLMSGWFFLLFLRKKKLLFFIAAIFVLILTMYTYNSYKLIAPLTMVVCAGIGYQKFIRFRKKIIFSLIGFVLCSLPLLIQGNNRFFETSAFFDFSNLSQLQKLFVYPMIYFSNYLSYFSLPVLFVTGDGFGRHTIIGMGPLFRWELLFLLSGIFTLLQFKKRFVSYVILFLLLVAPLTAALARPSPHMLRGSLLIIPLTILVAWGLVILWKKKSNVWKAVIICLSLLAVYEMAFYLHLYYTHYPQRTALDWGGRYKEVVVEADNQKSRYEKIVINNQIGMIDSYRAFYRPGLQYEVVDTLWQKPHTDRAVKMLYITGSDPKKNAFLKTIQPKLIKNIYLKSSHEGIFVQFWEI